MEEGRLLASGRDSDIYEAGDTRLLRRARDGRSLVAEAEVMAFARSRGYPCPEVLDVLEGGSAMLMERVDGPTMLDDILRRPWRIGLHVSALASLHEKLHALRAPEGLPAAPGSRGDRLLHLDLHPLNVLMSSRGPVVVDWSNAARGNPDADVAATWILLEGGGPPSAGLVSRLLLAGRMAAVRRFLSHFDLDGVRSEIEAVARWKCTDANMSAHEKARIRTLAEREGRRGKGDLGTSGSRFGP